jgi:hypothetical protein
MAMDGTLCLMDIGPGCLRGGGAVQGPGSGFSRAWPSVGRSADPTPKPIAGVTPREIACGCKRGVGCVKMAMDWESLCAVWRDWRVAQGVSVGRGRSAHPTPKPMAGVIPSRVVPTRIIPSTTTLLPPSHAASEQCSGYPLSLAFQCSSNRCKPYNIEGVTAYTNIRIYGSSQP